MLVRNFSFVVGNVSSHNYHGNEKKYPTHNHQGPAEPRLKYISPAWRSGQHFFWLLSFYISTFRQFNFFNLPVSFGELSLIDETI